MGVKNIDKNIDRLIGRPRFRGSAAKVVGGRVGCSLVVPRWIRAGRLQVAGPVVGGGAVDRSAAPVILTEEELDVGMRALRQEPAAP
jgi:hypothetical protein